MRFELDVQVRQIACYSRSFYGIVHAMSDYLRFFILLVDSSIHKDQQKVIDYLIEERSGCTRNSAEDIGFDSLTSKGVD